MATCDTLEVDLSRVDLDITLEQYPCIDVEVLQPDIVIDIATVANQGPKGDKGDQGVAGPPGDQGFAGPPGQQGLPGNAATIAVGGTVTGAPGSSATVTNSGSSSAAVFNFSIPAGVQGASGGTGAQGNPGTPGAAATIAVGTTATGAPGSNATVTNSGSSSAATFNFTIPRGDVGPQGPQGPTGSGTGDMLKSVYDTNSNNIVDAAESVPWTGVTGKPATFSPSTHASTHLSAGSDPIAIATSVLAGLCPAVDNTTIQVVANKLSAVSLAWTAITGRPSTFPPDSTAMLKSVYDTNADNIVDHAALADTTPWTGITGVPATFAPSAHQASHVTGTDQIPSAGTSARGLMAQANNNPNAFYASDATQKQVTYAMLGGSQPGPIAHASTHVTGGTDVIVPASASTVGLLKQLSGNTTDFVDGTNACQNLVAAIQPTIWSARRVFNAVGNPNFYIAQTNPTVGTSIPSVPSGTRLVDRWFWLRSGTHQINAAQVGEFVNCPGTSFMLTDRPLLLTLATAQTTLAAGDYGFVTHTMEGVQLRELFNDVHSVSILIKSTKAGQKFSYFINDPTGTRTYTKLCTIPSSGVWTIITIPNIPAFPPAGTWAINPGFVGLSEGLCFGSGITNTSGSDGSWVTGSFVASPGTDNWFNNTISTTQIELAFIQHEPGAVCTTPMDCPFSQNLTACQRYFAKSYDYALRPGANTGSPGMSIFTVAPAATFWAVGSSEFPVPMAKTPTFVSYAGSGTVNAASIFGAGEIAVNGSNLNTARVNGISFASAQTGGSQIQFNYTSDTGW